MAPNRNGSRPQSPGLPSRSVAALFAPADTPEGNGFRKVRCADCPSRRNLLRHQSMMGEAEMARTYTRKLREKKTRSRTRHGIALNKGTAGLLHDERGSS